MPGGIFFAFIFVGIGIVNCECWVIIGNKLYGTNQAFDKSNAFGLLSKAKQLTNFIIEE